MDVKERDNFIEKWRKYFGEAELPIASYYADEEHSAEIVQPGSGWRCLIEQLQEVRNGASLAFTGGAIGCPGGKRYTGFTDKLRPGFEFFLSCGIPGKMEGERYKKTPELVRELLETMPQYRAPAKYIVFKRWDKLNAGDEPAIAIFYATPDVLAGLFTLANFDRAEPNGVAAPFAAGCGTAIQYPYLEQQAANPRAFLGMFDPSARPFVGNHILTFSVPMKRLRAMIADMDESFLITPTWDAVRKRIGGEK